MNLHDKLLKYEKFRNDWWWVWIRGVLMLGIGGLLALAALSNPQAALMHASDFSWLPAAGFILLAAGLTELFDAVLAKEIRQFVMNLQPGLLDVVVAGLIILSIGGHPERLSMMIAAFLIVKGVYRVILINVIRPEQSTPAKVSAWISVLLGILAWQEWPSSGAGFLAFCLSADIGLRGWTVMMLARWLKSQGQTEATGA